MGQVWSNWYEQRTIIGFYAKERTWDKFEVIDTSKEL